MRCISAGVRQNIQTITFQCSVAVHAHLPVNGKSVAGTGCEETLFTAKGNFHRNAAKLAGQECRHWLFQYILFITKTATDKWFDDSYA
ncbi:Uncharacterised protein [Klebsiella pneumoniae]|nr:Uncharacterised protein [Klebsiella pneumoniae]